jgi:hypothetical protein
MPLNLGQSYRGTIVDRVCEWGEDGKERGLNPILRGMIVKVDGSPEEDSVKGVYVCFGSGEKREIKDLAKKIKPVEVTVNQVSVMAFPIKAAELNQVHDHESRQSREAWNQLFKFPTNVGVVYEQRRAKSSGKRKTLDILQLTPKPEDGPVKDEVQLGEEASEE